MASSDYSQTFEQKFIEVVELLLKQQNEAENRRETVEREQRELLEQLDQRIHALTQLVEATSTDGFGAKQPEPSRAGNSAAKPPSHIADDPSTNALSEWERQKNMLLSGLEPQGEVRALASDQVAPDGSSLAPADASSAVPAAATHDWIEQLDPNDPALSDEDARRDLVGRLRKLEVELSLERAKLARERSELDAQLNELQRAERQLANGQSAEASGKRKDQGKVDRMLRFLGRKSSE
jgi:hypothetical protein